MHLAIQERTHSLSLSGEPLYIYSFVCVYNRNKEREKEEEEIVATPMIILIFNSFFMCPYLKEVKQKKKLQIPRVCLSSVFPLLLVSLNERKEHKT